MRLPPSALVVVCAAALLGSAGAAWAQIGVDVKKNERNVKLDPPTIQAGRGDQPNGVWGIVGGVVVMGLCVTANLIPCKRGHQD